MKKLLLLLALLIPTLSNAQFVRQINVGSAPGGCANNYLYTDVIGSAGYICIGGTPTLITGGSVAIGGTVTDGTDGSVPYIATGPVLAQDNANFFWNAANFSLEIGDNDYTADASDARVQISYVNTRSGLILRNVSNSNLRTHQFTTASGFGRMLMYSDTGAAGTNVDLQAGTTRTSTFPGHLTLFGALDQCDFVTLSANDATPSVAACGNVISNNSMATTVTNLDGAFNGGVVRYLVNDSNTSLAQTGNIVLSTSGTHLFLTGELIVLTCNGTVCTQEGTVASQLLDPTAISTITCNFSLFRSTGLADTDDLLSVSNCSYPGRAITITSVRCQSVGGTPDVMLQRNDGSAANLLTGSITCSTSTGGAAGTIATAEDNFAATDTLDFLMGTAGATTQISILITATVDSI